LEAPFSSEHLAFVGSFAFYEPLLLPYRLCLDAEWERDGTHQIQPRGKPFAVGEPRRYLPEDSVLTTLNDSQLSEVMSGTAYLHELGVVHGDLKGVTSATHDPVHHLTDRLTRQTFSLTTTVPPSLQTLVLRQCRLTSAQFPCPQLPFPLRERFVG